MSTSLLATDGYKFSMAEAGWPLRVETFYYAHRKGGAQVVPFEAEKVVRALLPSSKPADYQYLASHEYEMGAAFKAAVKQTADLRIDALPKGAWFFPREPILSITGASALVSWLEPMLLQLNYRIQIATLALSDPVGLAAAVSVVTCDEQREIALETLDAVGVKAPTIAVDSEGYHRRVKAQAEALAEITGDAGRLFEVGLRAASCLSQHLLALAACKEAGIVRTSNVHGARSLGMVPVGTMGHEHVQRYGSDAAAFRAMRERRPQRSSYLLDTFDTMKSGIPAAFALIAEHPDRADSIRYDSGDKVEQYLFAIEQAKKLGIRPVQIIEDGCDADMTRRFEALRQHVGWRPEEQFYGYGGYLIGATSGSPLTRDRVAAVYKLAQTGQTPTMKFGNETGAGKQSIPGRPVVFRRRDDASGPSGLIGQHGEAPPDGYDLLTNGAALSFTPMSTGEIEPPGLSLATRALVGELLERRAQ